ncbi:MAG: hypothetical protein ABSA39_22030 [Edaphobacter sp.]|jgi:hypothetical protein
MEPKKREPWERHVFFSASIVFIGFWLMYCVHLARVWQGVDLRLHSDALGLAIISIAMWIQLLREKASWQIMTSACIFLAVASHLAFRFF